MTRAALIVFWDYDTQWGADRSRTPGGPKNYGMRDFHYTDELLEIHGEHDVPACFAVVGAAALAGARPYHDPVQIRALHAAGHEIASHSYCHEWLPALSPSRLRSTLQESRDALEQCIGARVVTFVPPFNAPFDHASAAAWSFSERREVKGLRTDVRTLVEALDETGYRLARLSFRPLLTKVLQRIFRTPFHKPGRLQRIYGIQMLRLNTPCGFGSGSIAMLHRCAQHGGLTVVYGHPHSLHGGGAQDRRFLVPFLRAANDLRRQGRIEILRPCDLIGVHLGPVRTPDRTIPAA